MKLKLVLFLISFLTSSAIFAQYFVSGKVLDKQTKESLVGAIVKIDGTSKAVFTDFDGNFKLTGLTQATFNIEVSYISYVTKKINGVRSVDSLSKTKMEVLLEQEGKQLNEVVVAQTKITNTETSAVMEMKKSNTIVNTVSAAQISKSQDRDASEVVRRIPSVSIIDNRFIMVRGLSDRYNNVWLNDAGAPSSEVDKKSFSFDVVSSNLIDRILVFKTASPELPGDFAGGMVKIFTSTLPEKTGFVVGSQLSYRENTTGNTFYHTKSYKNDNFGNGYADRSLPNGTPIFIDNANPDQDQTAITNSFKNDWAIYQKKAAPDGRFNFAFNGLVKKGAFKFGSVTALNYANTYQTLNIHRQTWDDTTQITDYSDIQSINNVRISGVQNFAIVYKNQKIEIRNLFNQVGRMQTTQRNSNILTANNEKSIAELYERTRNYSRQISGTHPFFNGKTEYNWTVGYAINTKDVPDYKRITYTKKRIDPDSAYYTSIANKPNITNAGMFFSNLNEKVKSFNHNIKQTITIKNYSFELNAGNYFENKQRRFVARELGYSIIPGNSMAAYYLKFTPLENIFAPENLNHKGGLQVQETTNPYDSYNAQNKHMASYLSANFPFYKNHFKLQGGVRYEYNVQSLQSKVSNDTITPSIITKFLLPSANLAYNFNFIKPKDGAEIYKNIIRLAYSKTLNRPEFREWAPLYFYDFDFNRSIYGSLYPNSVSGQSGSVLNVAEIQNYDFRYEFYPSAGEFIQIGAFYKTFTNPIVQIILVSGDPSFTFKNAQSASVKGFEIDVRKKLKFIDEWTKIRFFKNLSVVGNLSIIQSQMYNPTDVNFQIAKTTLQNQSPYLYNVGLYYQNDSTGTQISLLYNVFGNRLSFVGTSSDANIGEIGRKTLDLSISQRIYKKLYFTCGVQNMLNAAFRLVQDTNRDGKYDTKNGDKEIMNYKLGAYYSAGIKLTL